MLTGIDMVLAPCAGLAGRNMVSALPLTRFALMPRTDAAHSYVGFERGSVSPRKVSSGGPSRFHNTRSRIPSRSPASAPGAIRTRLRDQQRARGRIEVVET